MGEFRARSKQVGRCAAGGRQGVRTPAGESSKLTKASGDSLPPSVCLLASFSCLLPCLAGAAAPIDESKLPPPATNRIDFGRDIQPIFEASCFKCHGPEKPKSHFRLDNRAAALKGGENGVDILPGQSAKSPLIHYVARLVEEMEMPPKGKGDPLTPEQIARLRAWIDQGAAWGATLPETKTEVTLAPALGWSFVSGNKQEFREHFGRHEGENDGIGQFTLKDTLGEHSKIFVEGHSLRDEYKVSLSLEREEFGFVHAGTEKYRKYFSDAGGFYQTNQPALYSLNRDLHLDEGRSWVDFGLTLPNLPRLIVGYEYQYQDGAKSTLQWGPVAQGLEADNATPRQRAIYPAFKEINERVNILKLDLDHELAGVRIEDNFRAEFYNLTTHRVNDRSFDLNVGDTSPSRLDDAREHDRHFHGVNTFRLEKQFTGWFFGSAGYLFSHLDGDGSFNLNFIDMFGTPPWNSQSITLERESHVFNVNGLLGPWDGLTVSAGVQNEWSRQNGLTEATLQGSAAQITSHLDTANVEEKVALRYTKIPFTVLFAEARLQQEHTGQFEQDVGGGYDFLRDTSASTQLADFRAGFNTSPWQRLSFNAHYRHYDNESRYNHLRDEAPIGEPGDGYSAFIRWRDLRTDEAEARLVGRVASWLKATLSYKVVATDFHTATDPAIGVDPVTGAIIPVQGGTVFAGDTDSHTYSLNAAITPWRRLFVSSTFSFRDSRTVTAANNVPSIVPYRGHTYSLLTSANYAFNEKTDFQLAYAFSHADYTQHNEADGLPLGINYQRHWLQAGIGRRLLKDVTARLQYGFLLYDEPSSGHFTDYTAHTIFATVTMKFH